jgi:predicted acetyltransferase
LEPRKRYRRPIGRSGARKVCCEMRGIREVVTVEPEVSATQDGTH